VKFEILSSFSDLLCFAALSSVGIEWVGPSKKRQTIIETKDVKLLTTRCAQICGCTENKSELPLSSFLTLHHTEELLRIAAREIFLVFILNEPPSPTSVWLGRPSFVDRWQLGRIKKK
jgi:hypothetical protein